MCQWWTATYLRRLPWCYAVHEYPDSTSTPFPSRDTGTQCLHCHWSVSLLATNRRHVHSIQALSVGPVSVPVWHSHSVSLRLRDRVSDSFSRSQTQSQTLSPVSDCCRHRSAAACVGILLICTGYIVGRTARCQCWICWPTLYFRLRIESEENDGFCIRRHCWLRFARAHYGLCIPRMREV